MRIDALLECYEGACTRDAVMKFGVQCKCGDVTGVRGCCELHEEHWNVETYCCSCAEKIQFSEPYRILSYPRVRVES